jgi:hypothetical protein
MNGDLLNLPDGNFCDAWRAMGDEERSAVGEAGFHRYAKLTPYVDEGIERLRREQERRQRAEPKNVERAEHDKSMTGSGGEWQVATSGWPGEEVEALNAARIAGKTDAEIRALVVKLEAARVNAR